MGKIFRVLGVILTIILIHSCKKTDLTNVLKDIDGNVYNSVTIGTQVWMAGNLKTTKYSNGDLIGTTTPDTLDISGESSPTYQWVYDGDESNADNYGRLYTWYAVTDSRNVCPKGWHVPSDAEWTTLTTFLGDFSVAGGKLKETGTTHWKTPNTGATNETDFTALPGGYRLISGTFNNVGIWGYWWSSTEDTSATVHLRTMYYNISAVLSSSFEKQYGFSVRCLKD